MKIGISTFHYVYNEGALAQAYCLAQNLQNRLPNSRVELLDRRYPSKMAEYGSGSGLGREKSFNDFIENVLPRSEVRFEQQNNAPVFDYINRSYRALLVGSDEVWKLKYRKRLWGLFVDQKSPSYPAFPNSYWPDRRVKVPKIGYAVSIGGKMDWSAIPRSHINLMRNILADFSLIGYRDQRTLDFLKWIDPGMASTAEWVPDPTFSHNILDDVNKQGLKRRLEEYGVDFSKPRVCVLLHPSYSEKSVINRFFNQGYQTIGLSVPNENVSIDLSNKYFTPIEWFSVFGLMDACVSERMHGCIACLQNGTPFIAIDHRNPYHEESKIQDLMRSFGLLDYYYRPEENNEERLLSMCAQLIGNDWHAAKPIIESLDMFRAQSAIFTTKILKFIS
jgi:hypothetical protein